MKLRNLFFASLAMVTFAACSNDDEPAMPDNNTPVDAGVVNINITPENLTKSAPATKAETETGTTTETAIKSFTVYVFEGEAYLTQTTTPTSESALTANQKGEYGPATISSGLKTNTEYTFVAVANGPKIDAVADLETLKETVVAYNMESFIMSGNQKKSLTQVAAAEQTPETVTIAVSRRLAAVQVESVTIDLSKIPAENFKNATAKLTDIYLVNVRESSYLGSEAASGVEIENKEAKYMYGSDFDIKTENDEQTWGKENSNLRTNPNLDFPQNNILTSGLGQAVRLYASPTTSPDTEKNNHPLMLKLRIQYTAKDGFSFENELDPTHAIRYYTIYLKQEGTAGTTYGVKNNTLYKVTATLTGLGSKKDNEIEETAGDVEAFITVLPWEVKEQLEPDIKD